MLFYQPTLHGVTDSHLNDQCRRSLTFLTPRFRRSGVFPSQYYNVENNLYTQLTFCCFFYACLYTASFLPYGRFYNRIGGNPTSLHAFMFIFAYLTFPFLRKPYTMESIKLF